jgi:hypothetical protein
MATRTANIKGINVLGSPRGGEKGVTLVLALDLANQVFTTGSDTITIGGGGNLYGVTNTLTLAQIIAQVFKGAGGAFTIDWVGGVYEPGYQSGNPLFPAGTLAISGGNITGLTVVTSAGGASGQSTTSAPGWDAAMSIVIGGHFASSPS